MQPGAAVAEGQPDVARLPLEEAVVARPCVAEPPLEAVGVVEQASARRLAVVAGEAALPVSAQPLAAAAAAEQAAEALLREAGEEVAAARLSAAPGAVSGSGRLPVRDGLGRRLTRRAQAEAEASRLGLTGALPRR